MTEEIAALTSRAECLAAASTIRHATALGEELEALLEDATGIDRLRPDRHGARSHDVAIERLRRILEGGTQLGARQLAATAEVAGRYATTLDALPAQIEVASVGGVTVVRASTMEVMATWSPRIGRRRRLHEVYNEVRRSLADLVAVRAHLDLGLMRLE